jgi:hypothetical protein
VPEGWGDQPAFWFEEALIEELAFLGLVSPVADKWRTKEFGAQHPRQQQTGIEFDNSLALRGMSKDELKLERKGSKEGRAATGAKESRQRKSEKILDMAK